MNAVRLLSRRRPLLTCYGRRRLLLDVATRSRQLSVRFASDGSSAPPEPKTSITNSDPEKTLLTLAIETSCDDTCVALLEKERGEGGAARVLFQWRITADNRSWGGINPLPTVEAHTSTLAKMIQAAMEALPPLAPPDGPSLAGGTSSTEPDGSLPRRIPDFVSVTRGPGMNTALSVGLNTAKGLALAWGVPFVGVHHMQAHLLTPRLVSALKRPFGDAEKAKHKTVDTEAVAPQPAAAAAESGDVSSVSDAGLTAPSEMNLHWPRFPFFTLLVSGGHTMLLRSKNLVQHTTLAEVEGFAAGDALDKCARAILPAEYHGKTSSYASLLEKFVYPQGSSFFNTYKAPMSRAEEIATVAPSRRLLEARTPQQRSSVDIIYTEDNGPRYPWALRPPLAKSREMKFAFGGLHDQVLTIVKQREAAGGMDYQERRVLGHETMRIMFEHLGSRVLLYLDSNKKQNRKRNTTKSTGHPALFRLMVGGGVASNKFLRLILRQMLEAHGYKPVVVFAPPVGLCTDNAVMVAWAGMEMFEAGCTTHLSALPKKKWALDHRVDGGILGNYKDGLGNYMSDRINTGEPSSELVKGAEEVSK
ncbi:hypothetical protein PpBr36_08976 [Pyricularia pennisetigena]|uniref:hypothetical protein n=1 Tax=Pyricularia pennisetigena TaxID=1578925 RepID=UPI00114F7784|nr:hypothetical protein PpBr36_08976 [Pyricularia pennisetigena]TLS23794.1 hypothetical protein PpBr36_08976 [Pyricularia pennisetigena]